MHMSDPCFLQGDRDGLPLLWVFYDEFEKRSEKSQPFKKRPKCKNSFIRKRVFRRIFDTSESDTCHGIPGKQHCVWWEVNKTPARSPLFHEDRPECSSYKSSKDNPSLWVGNHQQIRVYVESGSQWVSAHFQTSVEN